jgi:uncharacterized protein YbbC (DUF1343 family)/CubicO group peptidase (beta-lactamase class C family)
MIRRVMIFWLPAILLSFGNPARLAADDAKASRLPQAAPEEAGMDRARLAAIDGLVARSLDEGQMPGCVVAIGRQGRLVWLKAYGQRQVLPAIEPMTTDTVFDLASLTKPIATATSIVHLVESGRLRLRDKASQHWPQFAANGKEHITVFQLLTHQSGLIADNPLSDYADGSETAMRRIAELGLVAPPGERFIYSDVNYIVLAEIVARVSGKNVHQFTQEFLFQPLGMSETGYLPDVSLCRRAAPTEQRDEVWMKGQVHDPRAFALGGIAGHAGLFSTAEDLSVYAQMMLGRGSYQGRRILGPATMAAMTSAYTVPGGNQRGLGWDKRSSYSSNRGELFSSAAFGHGGFTGTALWIDPELDLFVIFLSNRLHPTGKGLVNPLAGRIGTIAAAAIVDSAAEPAAASAAAAGAAAGEVLTGIDVLRRDGFSLLKGRRVGLITNHTGLAADGITTARALQQADGVTLVSLFSPEHGFEGKLDVSKIDDTVDAATGLKVYSLYGETRRPSAESLQDIDTLVFDIQDIGTRFYTYVSTMGLAMQAAAEHGLRFVVLDRPNPINGCDVEGPVLDAGRESFVGFHTIPVRHGMTVAELARMIRDEQKIDVDLQVVQVEGWQRHQFYDATGLLWVNPSPNMRTMDAALLYPGIGLLETTNLSVGRGTDSPFEILGAPWIEPRLLAQTLNARDLPGVRFVPLWFTPSATVHAQQRCGGVRIVIVNRSQVRPVQLGLTVAHALRQHYPGQWQAERCDRLLCSAKVLSSLLEGAEVAVLEELYQPDLREFLMRRDRYLLYP